MAGFGAISQWEITQQVLQNIWDTISYRRNAEHPETAALTFVCSSKSIIEPWLGWKGHRAREWVGLERSLKVIEPGSGWVGKVLH